jgi:CheY-like chemotaxis protein
MSDVFVDLGYTVDMAYDGPGALELSGQHQYRLALLDYKMPGMDGLELCRRMRGSQPAIVVVLVTAFAAATTSAASEAGVRRVLSKPVDFAVLMPLVEEAFGSS